MFEQDQDTKERIQEPTIEFMNVHAYQKYSDWISYFKNALGTIL